jgi:hypothetical protein
MPYHWGNIGLGSSIGLSLWIVILTAGAALWATRVPPRQPPTTTTQVKTAAASAEAWPKSDRLDITQIQMRQNQDIFSPRQPVPVPIDPPRMRPEDVEEEIHESTPSTFSEKPSTFSEKKGSKINSDRGDTGGDKNHVTKTEATSEKDICQVHHMKKQYYTKKSHSYWRCVSVK